MNKFNRKQIKIDGIYMEISIIDTISSSKSELDQNRPSNLAGLESESSTIQCRTPNPISLQGSVDIANNVTPYLTLSGFKLIVTTDQKFMF